MSLYFNMIIAAWGGGGRKKKSNLESFPYDMNSVTECLTVMDIKLQFNSYNTGLSAEEVQLNAVC